MSSATLCSVIKKLMLEKLSPCHAGFKLVPGKSSGCQAEGQARVSGSCKPLPFWCYWAAWPLGLLPSAQDFGQGYCGCYRRWAYHRVEGLSGIRQGSRTSSPLDRLMPVLAPTTGRPKGIHPNSCQGCGVWQVGRQKRRHRSL